MSRHISLRKQLTLVLIFSFIFCACEQTESAKNKTGNNLPDCLKKYEIGMKVYHSPDPAYAEYNSDSTSKYIWKHETSVISLKGDLKIKEFGSYMLWNGKWYLSTMKRIPYTPEDFEDWYNCKDAIIKDGKTYIDKKNWAKSDILEFVDPLSIWYYIGISKNGKEYLGFAYSNYISELNKN